MEFTNAEKDRITQLYGNDFADIAPADGLLIAKWENWKATEQARNDIAMQELKRETETKIDNLKRQGDEAMSILADMRAEAVKRFERLSDGKEK